VSGFHRCGSRLLIPARYSIEVEALQAELAEEASRLRRLQDRLEVNENEKQETSSAIANAQRILVVQKNSTRAEVFKLKSRRETICCSENVIDISR
jgi:kinetochore protein Spc7/SPC105